MFEGLLPGTSRRGFYTTELPGPDTEAYREKLASIGWPEEVAAQLHTRTLTAMQMPGIIPHAAEDGSDELAVGLLVVESARSGVLNGDAILRDVYQHSSEMARLIQAAPHLGYAIDNDF